MNISNNEGQNPELLLQVVDETNFSAAINLIRDAGNFKHAIYHLKFRIDRPTDLPFFQSTYPAEWIGRYMQKQYSDIDPLVLNGFDHEEPFIWSDLVIDTPDKKNFFADSVEHGVGKSGLSVPLTDKTQRQALFSVTSDMDDRKWRDRMSNEMPWLQQIGDVLHRKAIAHLHKPEDTLSLAPREIECLNWTAKGKDSPTIAGILGISEYTVRDYIKSARHKLGCSTVAQAVYEATIRRIIDI